VAAFEPFSLWAGEERELEVRFTPDVEGAVLGVLEVRTDATNVGREGVMRLGMAGQGVRPRVEVKTGVLDFGDVEPGGVQHQLLRVLNPLQVESPVHLVLEGADADQFSFSEASALRVLKPTEELALRVSFTPTRAGDAHAIARVSGCSTCEATLVPLSGTSSGMRLEVTPARVDFGLLAQGASLEAPIVVRNLGTQAVEYGGVKLLDNESGAFRVVSAPTLAGNVLAPGEMMEVRVAFSPSASGPVREARVALDVRSPGTTRPGPTVSLAGEGGATCGPSVLSGLGGVRTDQFPRKSQSKVDVLFVVDNSGSMREEQESLGRNFAAFLSHANLVGADYHITVTTTGIEPAEGGWMVCPGGARGGEGGRFFPVDGSSPRIITPVTPASGSVFERNTLVGDCHWDEKGLDAMHRALSAPLVSSVDDPSTPLPNDGNAGFLREDARLSVIVVSDEDDAVGFSTPPPVSFYEAFLLGLKGNDRSKVSFSAVVGPRDLSTCPGASNTGSRYIALAEALGGVVENICTPNWAASLELLSEKAFGPNRHFQLTAMPSDASRFGVRVDGLEVKDGWSYDESTRTLLFKPGAEPSPGATVTVTYPVDC
jgi:hypothetical protein